MVKSKSEQHLDTRDGVPKISPNMYKQVSEERRAMLNGEVENGLFKDGSLPSDPNYNKTSASNIMPLSTGIKKNAQVLSSTGVGVSGDTSSGWRGSGGTERQVTELYSPLYLASNLNLPRDRATINAWCRAFYALNPIVQNAINLHSTYPISKLNIKCPNKKIENFFNEMIEEIDLMNICVQAAQEFWLLGEAFVYGELDERTLKWSRLVIQNPDYIVLKKTVVANEPLIMLRPDENLRRIVFSTKPSDVEQRKQLNENIINHIRRGENIPLDNFYVSHLARRIAPYEVRGTGLPVSVFRQLMLFDLIRESKFAQASNLINPLTIIKVGSAEYKPTLADLQQWRDTFAEAQNDRDFKIFTHEAVTVEKVGSGGAIYDTSGDINQLLKEIYIGLMVPQVIIEGGGDITYANGGVSLEVLKQRYISFRNMMSSWLKMKIFAPISKLNEFYDYKDGKKTLIVPDIDWNHMNLFDAADYINILVNVSSGEAKRVSTQTLYRSLGLEWEEERRKIRKEDIAESIRKKEIVSLEKMNLNELRAISDDSEIPEVVDTPDIGISPYSSDGMPLPGETGGGGGGGGGGLGGLELPPSLKAEKPSP